MEPEKTNMHEIKAKVDRLEEVVEDSLETQRQSNIEQRKTNEKLGELVTLMRVEAEGKKRQEEINKGLLKSQEETDKRLSKIEIGRAEEKHSREFLSKYWPWMMVGCVLATGLVAAAVSGLGRSLVG